MTFIEKWKEFEKQIADTPLDGKESLVYIYLLMRWNRTGRKSAVRYGDDEMQKVTGLGRFALRNARRGLEAKGYVSVRIGRGTRQTEYTIL